MAQTLLSEVNSSVIEYDLINEFGDSTSLAIYRLLNSELSINERLTEEEFGSLVNQVMNINLNSKNGQEFEPIEWLILTALAIQLKTFNTLSNQHDENLTYKIWKVYGSHGFNQLCKKLGLEITFQNFYGELETIIKDINLPLRNTYEL